MIFYFLTYYLKSLLQLKFLKYVLALLNHGKYFATNF